MPLIRIDLLPKRLVAFVCLIPFLYVLGLIIEAKITFYPFTPQFGLYDYEGALLWLLLAPFFWSLPPASNRPLRLARKLYWVSAALLLTLAVLFLLVALFLA